MCTLVIVLPTHLVCLTSQQFCSLLYSSFFTQPAGELRIIINNNKFKISLMTRKHYRYITDDHSLQVLGWCGVKDIAEVAGPAVAGVLSLWELLMLRVDCKQQHSRVSTLYQELCQLLQKVQSVAHRLFRPLNCPVDNSVTVKVSTLPSVFHRGE